MCVFLSEGKTRKERATCTQNSIWFQTTGTAVQRCDNCIIISYTSAFLNFSVGFLSEGGGIWEKKLHEVSGTKYTNLLLLHDFPPMEKQAPRRLTSHLSYSERV